MTPINRIGNGDSIHEEAGLKRDSAEKSNAYFSILVMLYSTEAFIVVHYGGLR